MSRLRWYVEGAMLLWVPRRPRSHILVWVKPESTHKHHAPS